MAIENGYCSLAEFKAFGGIKSTNAGDDAVLEQIIEAVSRYIDQKTGLYFYADDAATKVITPKMADMLQLGFPLRTVTTLKTDDDGDGTYENTWETTDYHLMPLNASVFHWIQTNVNGNYSFPVGILAGVQIIGNCGYAAIPADIKMVCMNISKNVEGRRDGQGSEAVEITAAGILITPKDISAYDNRVLMNYRRPL